MFDYSCPSSNKEAIKYFVHPGATWTPYDRYYGEEIVLRWTVLYDEPTEAVLVGPDSNFSVVRVILKKGIVSAVEHMVDDDAKAFLDQYECPPDQIAGLYGKHPLGRIRERPVSHEGQSLASIIESRSARVDEALGRVGAEKAAAQKKARETLLRTLRARRHSKLSVESTLAQTSTPSTMVAIPPLATISLLESVVAFVALSTVSVIAGIVGAVAGGLGVGIAVLCVTVGAGSYLTLSGFKKRNKKKAASSPHLEYGEGRVVVPQSGGPLIFDLTNPYDLYTDWRQFRTNNTTSYQTRMMLTQGEKTIVFYSLDPVQKDSLVKMGFLQPDGLLIPESPGSASFGLLLSDHLKLWRHLRDKSGHW